MVSFELLFPFSLFKIDSSTLLKGNENSRKEGYFYQLTLALLYFAGFDTLACPGWPLMSSVQYKSKNLLFQQVHVCVLRLLGFPIMKIQFYLVLLYESPYSCNLLHSQAHAFGIGHLTGNPLGRNNRNSSSINFWGIHFLNEKLTYVQEIQHGMLVHPDRFFSAL